MKKVLVFAVAVMMLLSMAGAAFADKLSEIQEKGVLTVGANVAFPPYEFYWTNPETGEEELAGFDMSLAKGIADMLGVELDLQDQAFAGLITALSFGELDAIISGLAIKPERLEVVDFSDPYFTGAQIMLIRAEDADTLKTVEDMKGKKVGAQLGSLQQNILEEQFSESEPLILEAPPVLALELYNKNIDGWLIADLVAQQYMVVYPDSFVISEIPVNYDTVGGAGVAVQKGDNEALLEKINAYIAQVKADGTWDAWMADAIEKSANLLKAE